MLYMDPLDFTLDYQFSIDLTAVVQAAQLAHPIQACFLDCAAVPFGNTTLQVFGSGQRIVAQPGSQGYYPLLIPTNAYVFTLSNGSNLGGSVTTAPANLYFMNVPFVASQWQVSTAAASGGYGVGGLGGNPLGS